jgi:energy-coupling factor transport system permease protein
MTAALMAAFPLSRLPLARLRGMRALAITALFLGLLQFVFYHEGDILFQVGPLALTRGGLETGLYVAGRFVSVVLLSYLFVLTTEPNELAFALMRAGLPYRYGFTLITALRMVPMFEREGQIVYQAQLARGVRYDASRRFSPRRYLALARQFFLPLLVSALGKADALAVSMEGRCFGRYPTRTFLRQVHWHWRDGVALGALLVGLCLAGVATYVLQ